MAHTINTLIECPFNLNGAYSITVNGSPATINGVGQSKWYRPVLANGSNTGGATDPLSFASVLDTALGANWSVNTPDASGLTTITWSGVGTGTVSWSSGTGLIIRNLMGFTADLSLASGATATPTYPPAYRLLSISLFDDTDWRPEAAGSSYSETDAGTVYGINSGRVRTRRVFRFGFHPRDPSLTVVPGNYVFPSWSGSFVGKLVAPTDNLPSLSPPQPFSMLDFWSVARGRRLAGSLGQYQQLRVGAVPWDEFYLDKRTCETGLGVDLVRAAWNQVIRVGPWGILLVQAGVTF